jgi:hypothetical protein
VTESGTLTRNVGYLANKIPGVNLISIAARQFDIDLSRARGRKH